MRRWQSRLRDRCAAFMRLNVSAELLSAGEEAVFPGRLSMDAYMHQAMTHKFCVVSHGDDPTTHKLAETSSSSGERTRILRILPRPAHVSSSIPWFEQWQSRGLVAACH